MENELPAFYVINLGAEVSYQGKLLYNYAIVDTVDDAYDQSKWDRVCYAHPVAGCSSVSAIYKVYGVFDKDTKGMKYARRSAEFQGMIRDRTTALQMMMKDRVARTEVDRLKSAKVEEHRKVIEETLAPIRSLLERLPKHERMTAISIILDILLFSR